MIQKTDLSRTHTARGAHIAATGLPILRGSALEKRHIAVARSRILGPMSALPGLFQSPFKSLQAHSRLFKALQTHDSPQHCSDWPGHDSTLVCAFMGRLETD